MDGASPVARKEADVAVTVSAQAAAHVQETDIPYSIACSVPSSPSGLHLGACASIVRMATEVSLDTHHHGATAEAPQLLSQTGHPTLTISTEEPWRDRRFDHLKTFSSGSRVERQVSTLHPPAEIEVADSKISEEEEEETGDGDGDGDSENEVPSVDRYFSALQGRELETLRATEVSTLPDGETWPFLLRFPVSAFGMCLGVSSQAMLWKSLQSEPSMAFLHVSPAVNQALWWVSVALTAFVSSVYLLKAVFYFEVVRREFCNPIRVNFFFAPWVACLFLVNGLPRPVAAIHDSHVVWYVLMTPILLLDLKIYGQWMSGGGRRLSKVANPTSHLAIVGALLGALVGLHEAPLFFFAVGLAHYVVLFVTLYQWLGTNDVRLPKELHPVFFLFVAVPSVASMAWARLCGEFGFGAKIPYFISLFLFVSLVVRINLFFRGIRFSLAWWAYTFPMTSVAIATTMYASSVNSLVSRVLAIGLAGIASVTVTGVLVTTMYHAFVRKDLFPNDVSIAIMQRLNKPKHAVAQLARCIL
ncbi:S-type anion channel SLAH2-like [Miscanthus floridulus]|uniref:S-type anion channel SLAH2-like n=1 Tax=Miscanthus floridulus TaxID=154761 RepID=UPI0034594519